MDMDSRSFPRGDIRVSDADRDRAVAELSENFQSGRLTQEEFEQRSGQALQARTGPELSALFNDLPEQPVATVPPPVDYPPTPAPGFGGPAARGPFPSAARVILAFVVLAIIAGNVVSGNVGHGHGLGWLVPVVILGLVFLRLARRR
ncbi:MAG TPA: DUF1707 domain-containing protein [Trebonia sp.]|jgi:hypothetical protein